MRADRNETVCPHFSFFIEVTVAGSYVTKPAATTPPPSTDKGESSGCFATVGGLVMVVPTILAAVYVARKREGE